MSYKPETKTLKEESIVEKFEGKESQITFLPYDLFQIQEFYYLFKFVTVKKEMNQINA